MNNTTPYRWKPGLPADKHRRRFNATAGAGLVRMLQTGTPTMHDMVEQSGLCIHTVRAYTKALHVAGVIRIIGWEKDSRGAFSTPRWALGEGRDVPKPPPVDHADLQRAYRKVKKLRAAGFRPPRAADLARSAA